MIKLIIPLPPISKKNSQRILINRKTNTPFIMPSVKYEHYLRDCAPFIRLKGTDCSVLEVQTYPVNVECKFYMPTRRRCDLTNLLESMDDILVYYGVIADDDYTHIAAHDGSRVYYDKDNPRTEILITTMTGGAL